MLSTDQKGAIAEAAIALAALRLGIAVYRPMSNERYDMIFDIGQALLRVQCKWAKRRGDAVVVSCHRCRRDAAGLVRRNYTPEELDVFAAYCAPLDRCYLIPFDAVPPSGVLHLRLSPARNNQRARIRWASEFAFSATLASFGAIAQLGERRAGSAKVAGSSPAGSIAEPVPT